MTDVLELVANLVRTSANDLAAIARKTHADNVHFVPNGRGTTIKNQITECGVINQWTAQVLEARAMMGITMEEAEAFFRKAEVENETLEKALALLESSTVNLISAIRAFPVEKLEEVLNMPWGETRTFLTMTTKTVWNMNYHEGQINYIHNYLSEHAL